MRSASSASDVPSVRRCPPHAEAGRDCGLKASTQGGYQFDVFGPLFPPATPSDAPPLRSVRAFWTGGWRDPNATVERIDFLSSMAQARNTASLGSIPVHVISTGVFLNQALVPEEHRAALQERWEDLQQRLLKLSSRATYSVARSSGHFIQRDDPRAVLAVIRAAIAQARCAPGVPAVGGG